MIDDLKKSFLFEGLDRSTLDDIAIFCTRLHLLGGEVLIQENETKKFDLFILCRGFVEVVSNDSMVTSGEIVISSEDNELFGEISWLTRRKRTATVRCRGDVDAIKIEGAQLRHYLETNPASGYIIMRRIASLLSERLESTNSLLKQILWNIRI